jgi:DnaJ-class molecular chaperone
MKEKEKEEKEKKEKEKKKKKYDYISPQEKKPLECLGLPIAPGYDEKVIKRTFHKLGMTYHPDKNPANEEKFKEINSCYHDFLTILKRRAELSASFL